MLIVLIALWGQVDAQGIPTSSVTDAKLLAPNQDESTSVDTLGYQRGDNSLMPAILYRLSPLRRAGRDAGFDLLDSITPWAIRLAQRRPPVATLLSRQDTAVSPWLPILGLSSSVLFGHNFLFGRDWLLGLDGLLFSFPEMNGVDGLWCGYEVYLAHQVGREVKLSARTNAYYTTRSKRIVSHSYLTMHYAPRRDALLLVGGGLSNGNLNLLNGHQIFLQHHPSLPLGNGPVRTYERQWAMLRHEIDLLPSLRWDLCALYEYRRPIVTGVEKGVHRAFTLESRIRIQPVRHEQISPYDGVAYSLPSGFTFPELFLSYRQAVPLTSDPSVPYVDYGRIEVGAKGFLYTNEYAHISYYLSAGAYLWRHFGSEWDRKAFATTGSVTFDHFLYTYQTLPPFYMLRHRWAEVQMSYLSRNLPLGHLMRQRGVPIDEALHLRSIVPLGAEQKAYAEFGYSIGWSYLARIGFFTGFEYATGRPSFALRLSLPILQLTRLWGERVAIKSRS